MSPAPTAASSPSTTTTWGSGSATLTSAPNGSPRATCGRRRSLPVQIARPSIIVGEQASGWTTAFNVLYGPIRALSTGAYRALPLDRRAPLDVVPIDYVADALFELSSAGPNGTFHLVAGDRATTTGHVARMTAERFDKPRPWIVPPAVYRALYPLLRRALRGRQRLALERTQVFIPYLSIGVRFQDHVTRARLEPAGVRLLPLDEYFARLLDFALAADWGKRPLPHPRSATHAPQPAPRPQPTPARVPTRSTPILWVKSAWPRIATWHRKSVVKSERPTAPATR